ncbi:unnamed protein product [Orchesella dallaii]|uniref:FAD-binding PCMH-type domain-containing protein n=1 Tax=Orchesella dallaii TaxID=48710 RepID=A0ABP1PWE9_9HEXA
MKSPLKIFVSLYPLILFIQVNSSTINYFYKSYQNSVHCTASSPILYPENAEELQLIVQKAIEEKQTVKVLGSRHSITDVICTEGIPVSTKFLNKTEVSDDDTVTVESGAQLMDVLTTLHEAGKTLIHVPAYGGITIGGAIGTGAHGSSLIHPTTLSDQIVQLTIINGMGEFETIKDPDELKAFRVHLGLLGAIVNVTLRTVPLFKMVVYNYPESESILFDGTSLESARSHDWYQLWWFPNSKSVIVSKGNYTDDLELSGNAVTNLIPDVTSAEIISGRESFERAQATKNMQGQQALEDFTKYSLYREVVGKPPIYTETFQNGTRKFANPATGFAYRLQANRCSNKCAWDNGDSSVFPEESAMAFDAEEMPKVLIKMKGILEQLPAAFVMIGVFIRFSKASDALMSIGTGRDSVHIEWTTPMRYDPYTQPRDGIGAYQAILQAMVHDHDGRAHWGKNGQYFFTRDIFLKRVPNLEPFQKMMRKYDPNGIFLNKFGRRLLLEYDDLSMDPFVKRCALQDYCVCTKSWHCADFQMCTTINGMFPVCRDVLPPPPVVALPIPKSKYNSLNLTSIHEQLKKEEQDANNHEISSVGEE